MALNATFTQVLGVDLSLFTVIVGHATFCIVVVFNNAVARLRRSGTSLEEASMDLGANSWRTFRFVTFPSLRTALVAGALLAFALSFDEIIVTTFTIGQEQTLPIWIFANYARPNQLPIVNVVGLTVILLSIIPVYLANRLSQDPIGTRAGRRRRAERRQRRRTSRAAAHDSGERRALREEGSGAFCLPYANGNTPHPRTDPLHRCRSSGACTAPKRWAPAPESAINTLRFYAGRSIHHQVPGGACRCAAARRRAP